MADGGGGGGTVAVSWRRRLRYLGLRSLVLVLRDGGCFAIMLLEMNEGLKLEVWFYVSDLSELGFVVRK